MNQNFLLIGALILGGAFAVGWYCCGNIPLLVAPPSPDSIQKSIDNSKRTFRVPPARTTGKGSRPTEDLRGATNKAGAPPAKPASPFDEFIQGVENFFKSLGGARPIDEVGAVG